MLKRIFRSEQRGYNKIEKEKRKIKNKDRISKEETEKITKKKVLE